MLEGLRGIVLEDDAVHGRLLGLQLAACGVETHVVKEGGHFLKCLHAEAFDFAVVDLKLPDMDGRDCIRAVRGQLGLAIPIVVVSAYAMQVDRAEALAAGANGYVVKPYRSDKLADAIYSAAVASMSPFQG